MGFGKLFFTGFDAGCMIIGLVAVLMKLWNGEKAIEFIFGKEWKNSAFKKFFADLIFSGKLFIAGLVMGIIPDTWWFGLWKVGVIIIAVFAYNMWSRRKAATSKETKADDVKTS